MKTLSKILLLFALLFALISNAQQSVNTSGGNGTGIGGSFSYTVGQIDYVSATGSGGSISQGVQQPYEIFSLGTNEFPTITLQAVVYPNPTRSNVTLLIENHALENVSIQLFDISGKAIMEQKISQQETSIAMESLQTANYFLQVFDNGKPIKTFKIIKN